MLQKKLRVLISLVCLFGVSTNHGIVETYNRACENAQEEDDGSGGKVEVICVSGLNEEIRVKTEALPPIQGAIQKVVSILDKDVHWKNQFFVKWEVKNPEKYYELINWWGNQENTVTHSLSDVVFRVLSYRAEHPDEKILVVFDIDEALTHSPVWAKCENDYLDSSPLHPLAGDLLTVLHDVKIKTIGVTAGCFTVAKLQGSNISLSAFSEIIEHVGYEGASMTKGEAVAKHIGTTLEDQRPQHVFFVDDQAWWHSQRCFKEKVLSAGAKGVTVFQHEEYRFYAQRNKDLDFYQAQDE